MILDGKSVFSPHDMDDALAAVQCLLCVPLLEKEYELKGALHEIGRILCREKRRADRENYMTGFTNADLRRMEEMLERKEIP